MTIERKKPSDIETAFKDTKYGRFVLEVRDHYNKNRLFRLALSFIVVAAIILGTGVSKALSLLIDNILTVLLVTAALVFLVDGANWIIDWRQRHNKDS